MRLKPIKDFFYNLHYLNYMKRWQTADYKKKENETRPPRLTNDQKEQIKSYWGYLYDSEAAYEAFYNQYTESFDPRFLPENLYYLFIDPFLNDSEAAKVLDDKNLYDYLLYDVKRPTTIARIVHKEIYDSDFQPIAFEEFIHQCLKYDKIIVKPSVLTSSSTGVMILKKKEYLEKLSCLVNNKQSKQDSYVIQEFIEQHEQLGSLHADSINTIRLLTLNWKGQVKVLSGIVRMGVDGKAVDNASAGGIFVGLDDSGRLKQFAHNTCGKRFDRHPQGASFYGHYIPNYQELVELCVFLAPRFSSSSRLLSWDFAIGKDGHPILIEVNLHCGEIDFHQISNGPIFGDTTKEILDNVFSSRLYRFFRWWFNKIR